MIDRKEIYSTALISSAWTTSAKRLIWKKIQIKNSTINHLLELLDQSPSLVHLIQMVGFIDGLVPAVPRLLSLFQSSNLRAISINCSSSGPGSIATEDETYQVLSRLEGIESVAIGGVQSGMKGVLCRWRNLKHLQLHDRGASDTYDGPAPTYRLESIKLCWSILDPNISFWLGDSRHTLHTLKLYAITSTTLETLSSLLNYGHLTTLVLSLDCDSFTTSPPPLLPATLFFACSQLINLTLDVDTELSEGLLEALAGMENLTTVSLAYYCFTKVTNKLILLFSVG
jgi:hypothetical protein